MSQPPRNIELFNEIVAITLVKLYEAFPNPIKLNTSDIGCEVAHKFESDEAEAFELMMSTVDNSVQFLVREGFLQYDRGTRTLEGTEFHNAVLTMKGFTLLGSAPAGVDLSADRRPLVERLKGEIAQGVRGAVPELLKSLFRGAIGLVG